ncbi:MAG: cbb3-type cytochrome c oxidase subunit I, partial [Candidatus Rokubacteria bacterium]|nr:cbb3-type cytochrome c oxidase subunit I [Candidatus Rokubacteria bacterium]
MDATTFRTCAHTGLRVHLTAERLIKVHAVAGVLAILFGGIAAVLVVLTRWPAVHLLDPAMYYRALTFHGINMLIFWIIFFEIAILYFAAPIVLGSRVAWPRMGWVGFLLMVAGSIMIDVAILRGGADVMFTSYVPLRAVSYFYLGWILYAVGALIGVLNFFATLVVAKAEKTYEGSIPLVTFGALTAAIIAVVALAHGAIIYIPTWLWSLGIVQNLDAGMYRLVWWGLGHSSQQINVAAMVAVWYLLATLTVGAVPINEKVSRWAFVLYILFINLASAHHLLVDPQVSPAWKVWNTSYGMYLAVLASMIHGMTVPASVEVAQRRHGLSKGMFEWLTKAPWGNPGFAALFLSLVLFGFMGGITGVTFGAEQVNIISHNTLRIPGHFHSTVVAGTTLAFMGLTYFVVPLIWRRRIVAPKLATLQVYVFGIGIAIFAAGMTTAGSYAVP